MDTPLSRWIDTTKPSDQARLRLFCFPFAGGGAAVYRAWPGSFPSSIAVHAVRLPGRETRIQEASFRSLETLIPALAEGLLPLLDRPFAFFGHSMGGLISYELTRHLIAHHGLCPAHLFVSAHRAPQLPNPNPTVYRLPEDGFISYLRDMNGTPDEVLRNADLMQLVVPILRADFELCGTYQHQPGAPLPCPISAFAGTQDAIASYDQVEPWREQTSGQFLIRALPGNHFFLNSAQSLLLWAIQRDIDLDLAEISRAA